MRFRLRKPFGELKRSGASDLLMQHSTLNQGQTQQNGSDEWYKKPNRPSSEIAPRWPNNQRQRKKPIRAVIFGKQQMNVNASLRKKRKNR
jgi:hypothetical protein